MSTNSGSDSKNTLYCSFCGKSQHEVRKLIAGPTVFICDECVELCMVEAALERDNFMAAEDAKKWGLIDEIVTQRASSEEE